VRYFPLDSIVIPPDARLDDYQVQALTGAVTAGWWSQETLLNVVSYRVWKDQGSRTEKLLQTLLTDLPVAEKDLRFYLAEMYQRRGDWEKADQTYRQILEQAPDHAEVYLRLGMVAEARCRQSKAEGTAYEDAIGWYKKYYELRPDDLLGLKKLVSMAELAGLSEASSLQARFQSQIAPVSVIANSLGLSSDTIRLGQNLVINGDFESWEQIDPAGWYIPRKTVGEIPWNEALYEMASDRMISWQGNSLRISGIWSQQFPEKRSNWTGYRRFEEVPVKKTRLYLISLLYRTEGSPDQAAVNITFFDGNQKLPPTNGNWHQIVIITKSTAESIRPFVRLFSSGNVWYDEIQVRELGLPAEKLPDEIRESLPIFLTGQTSP
jgi:tetratricopeptide (TPR) repeat protein